MSPPVRRTAPSRHPVQLTLPVQAPRTDIVLGTKKAAGTGRWYVVVAENATGALEGARVVLDDRTEGYSTKKRAHRAAADARKVLVTPARKVPKRDPFLTKMRLQPAPIRSVRFVPQVPAPQSPQIPAMKPPGPAAGSAGRGERKVTWDPGILDQPPPPRFGSLLGLEPVCRQTDFSHANASEVSVKATPVEHGFGLRITRVEPDTEWRRLGVRGIKSVPRRTRSANDQKRARSKAQVTCWLGIDDEKGETRVWDSQEAAYEAFQSVRWAQRHRDPAQPKWNMQVWWGADLDYRPAPPSAPTPLPPPALPEFGELTNLRRLCSVPGAFSAAKASRLAVVPTHVTGGFGLRITRVERGSQWDVAGVRARRLPSEVPLKERESTLLHEVATWTCWLGVDNSDGATCVWETAQAALEAFECTLEAQARASAAEGKPIMDVWYDAELAPAPPKASAPPVAPRVGRPSPPHGIGGQASRARATAGLGSRPPRQRSWTAGRGARAAGGTRGGTGPRIHG